MHATTFGLIGAGSAGIKEILPAANELLWGTVSFLVLFLLLWKYAFPPAQKALQARSDKIRDDLESAEHDRGQAAALLADYRRQLAEAREESGRILEDARRRAEEIRREIQGRAEAESGRIIQRAQEEIAAERERAIAEIRREVGTLAVDLAGRVIGESLDRERQLVLVDRYIDDLAAGGRGEEN